MVRSGAFWPCIGGCSFGRQTAAVSPLVMKQSWFTVWFFSCFLCVSSVSFVRYCFYDTIMLTTSHIMSQVCFISNTNDKHILLMLGVDTLQGVWEKISDFFVWRWPLPSGVLRHWWFILVYAPSGVPGTRWVWEGVETVINHSSTANCVWYVPKNPLKGPNLLMCWINMYQRDPHILSLEF